MEMDLIGQAVHIRNVSKKLMFIDILEKLRSEDIYQNILNSKRITVMMKYTICGQNVINNARTSNSKIHVGDVVKFAGAFETNDQKIFIASSFNILTRWIEINPNKHFDPIPSR